MINGRNRFHAAARGCTSSQHLRDAAGAAAYQLYQGVGAAGSSIGGGHAQFSSTAGSDSKRPCNRRVQRRPPVQMVRSDHLPDHRYATNPPWHYLNF